MLSAAPIFRSLLLNLQIILNSPLTKSFSAVGSTTSSMPILILIPYVVSFLGCDDFVNGLLQMYRGTVGA